MGGTLLYVVGPSGSGKDALLDYALARLPAGAPVRLARRWITRPAGAGGERHIAVSPAEFESRETNGAFAMAWRANGHCYGIGSEIRAWLEQGIKVVVSGSREYLGRAVSDFPDLKVISVTVNPNVLPDRLERRGREVPVDIERRLERGRRLALPPGVAAVDIVNDEALDVGGQAMLRAILEA